MPVIPARTKSQREWVTAFRNLIDFVRDVAEEGVMLPQRANRDIVRRARAVLRKYVAANTARNKELRRLIAKKNKERTRLDAIGRDNEYSRRRRSRGETV